MGKTECADHKHEECQQAEQAADHAVRTTEATNPLAGINVLLTY